MKIRPTTFQTTPPVSKPERAQTKSAPTPSQGLQQTDSFQAVLSQNHVEAPTVSLTAPSPAGWGELTVEERQDNLKALQTLAQQLRDQGVPGVEIWGQLKAEAASRYANADTPAAKKADFIIQDVTLVTVGKDALKYLKQYEGLPRLGKIDPLVDTFKTDWEALGVPPKDNNWKAVGWAGHNLDTHTGEDFRPEINDKTKNQIYHTMFYEFMAYVTQDPLMVRAGSMVHEIRDGVAEGGISDEDHNASYVGAAVGSTFREMRDGNQPDTDIKHWGAMTMAAYGKNGGPEIQQEKAGTQAQEMHQKITHLLENKGLIWNAENLLIQGVDSLNQGFKRLKDIF